MQFDAAEQEEVRLLVGNHDSGSGDVAQFVKHLLSIHETLGSFPQHHPKLLRRQRPAIPLLSKLRQEN